MGLTRITSDGITDGTITGTDLATNVDLVDNQKLRLGTGNDLEIFHSGSDSLISNSTGALYLQNTTQGSNIHIRAKFGEESIKAIPDGSVLLYHNNVAKFQTSTDGVDVNSGHLTITDNYKARFGASLDLQIHHDGTNSIIEDVNDNPLWIQTDGAIRLTKDSATAYYATFNPGGAVELYYDGVKKFETTSYGSLVTGRLNTTGNISMPDDAQIHLGDSIDLAIYHTGSNSNSNIRHINTNGSLYIDSANSTYFRHYIDSGGTISFETFAVFNDDGAVELYHDNIKRIETTSSGASVGGALSVSNGIRLPDLKSLFLGDNDDFVIVHTGFASYINNNSGDLYIRNDNANDNANILIQARDGENSIYCHDDGAVELYYNGNKKFETRDAGATLTGDLYMGDDNKLRLGDLTGGDFKIYHDGSNSYLTNKTGYLYIQSDNVSLAGQSAGENYLVANLNGSVQLYYDSSKKFETSSSGISVTGAVYSSTGVFGEGTANNIDFTTDNRMGIHINGSEEFRFESDGDFHADGDVIAFSTTISSDEKLKENIKVVPDALNKVEALKGVTFAWKKNNSKSAGVIAQDVMGVLPEAVKEVQGLNDNESYLSVNYNALTSILVEAIKDLSARIKILEAK